MLITVLKMNLIARQAAEVDSLQGLDEADSAHIVAFSTACFDVIPNSSLLNLPCETW